MDVSASKQVREASGHEQRLADRCADGLFDFG